MADRKLNKYDDYSEEILRKIYLGLFPLTALNGLLGCLGTLVDSFVVSALLGAKAMAALGLTSPLTVFFWLFINVVSNGTTVVSGRLLGKGELDKVNGGFTASLAVLAGVGALLCAALMAFHAPIVRLLGATEELRPMAEGYIIGLALSAPGIALSGPLNSFLIFDNQQKKTLVSVILMVVVNAGFDIIFVRFLGMGMLGMGLATGLSYYCADAYMLTHFLNRKSTIHLDGKQINWRSLPEVIKTGAPVASMELCNFLRPIFFNRILLASAGVVAVSAFTAEGSLASFFGSLCGGAGGLTLTVGSVIAGTEDSASLNKLAKVIYKYGLMIVASICTLLFIFAGVLVRPFCGGDPEVMYMAARAARCLAICLVLNMLVMVTTRFYQALNYSRLVSVLNLLDYFVFPIAWISLLTPGMKADGAWMTLFMAELSTLVTIFVLLALKLKKLRISLREWVQFGEEFDVSPEDRLDTTLHSMEDVIGISEYMERFCLERGMSKRISMICALAIEEMAGNIVTHGFSDGKKHVVDIRVLHKGNRMTIRLRDDCRPFDPKQRIELVRPEDPAKNIGIRMIANLATEMSYQKLFKMNMTTIVVEEAQPAAAS